MFILFGWGHQTKEDYGATLPIKCPNCNNNVFWHLVHSKIWATIFFIPVFPYDSKYYLLCETCSKGIVLKGPQIDMAKRLNRVTLSFANKEITHEQYLARVNEIHLIENLEQQLVVSKVWNNSKGSQVRIKSGDIIKSICGNIVTTVSELKEALAKSDKTKPVTIELIRGETTLTVGVNLAENEKLGLDFK